MKKERTSKSRVELPQGLTLEQSIEIIYQHQKNCEKEGNYIQAEVAKRKVKELKHQYNRVNKTEIKARHGDEKQDLEKAHQDQLGNFNAEWDSIQRQFQADINKVQQEMLDRHRDELRSYEEELKESLPTKSKGSPQLINLKKIEENLAKHQNYVEAHKVQLRAQELIKAENEKYSIQRSQKIRNMLTQLRSKQDSELNALRQKILASIQQKKKQRANELDKLLQKYQNMKKELEFQQIQEINRLDRSLKGQYIAGMSKYTSKASHK